MLSPAPSSPPTPTQSQPRSSRATPVGHLLRLSLVVILCLNLVYVLRSTFNFGQEVDTSSVVDGNNDLAVLRNLPCRPHPLVGESNVLPFPPQTGGAVDGVWNADARLPFEARVRRFYFNRIDLEEQNTGSDKTEAQGTVQPGSDKDQKNFPGADLQGRRNLLYGKDESISLNQLSSSSFYGPSSNDTDTCVRPCSEWGSTEFKLPEDMQCNANAMCIYRSTTGEKQKSHVFCKDSKHAVCPPVGIPTCMPPNPHSTQPLDRVQWTVQLYIHDYTHAVSQVHLPINSKRPFAIHALYATDSNRGEPSSEVYVIAPYLPVRNGSLSPSASCNSIYCLWEHPDGSVDAAIARAGGPTFSYCRYPKNVRPSTHSHVDLRLRLSYDLKLFTPPVYLRTATVPSLGPVFLTLVTYIAPLPPKGLRARTRLVFHLREWLEFHLLQGYDRIVLYDAAPSSDHLLDTLLKEFTSGVSRVRWTKHSPHAAALAMTEALRKYGPHTQWITYLQTDEFLVPRKPFETVKRALQIRFARSEAAVLNAKVVENGAAVAGAPNAHINQKMLDIGDDQNRDELSELIPALIIPRVTFGPSSKMDIEDRDLQALVDATSEAKAVLQKTKGHRTVASDSDKAPENKIINKPLEKIRLSFERCQNITKSTVLPPFVPSQPRSIFRPRFVSGLQADGLSNPLLMANMDFPLPTSQQWRQYQPPPQSQTKPLEVVHADGVLDIYHYPYRSFVEYSERRKETALPPPTNSDLSTEWKEAYGRSLHKIFSPEYNRMFNFEDEMKRLLRRRILGKLDRE